MTRMVAERPRHNSANKFEKQEWTPISQFTGIERWSEQALKLEFHFFLISALSLGVAFRTPIQNKVSNIKQEVHDIAISDLILLSF